MTHKQVLNVLNSYRRGHQAVAYARLRDIHPDTADVREDDVRAETDSIIKGALGRSSFTIEEIDEILEQNLSKATAYKFIAYYLSVYWCDEFCTVEELKQAINSQYNMDINEFDELDFEEIIKARNLLYADRN